MTQLIDSHIEAVKLDLTLWVSHTDVLRDWTAEGRQRPVLLGLPAAVVATHWQSDTGKLVSTSAPSSGNDEGSGSGHQESHSLSWEAQCDLLSSVPSKCHRWPQISAMVSVGRRQNSLFPLFVCFL